MGLRSIGAMLGIIALALPVLELVGIYHIWQIAGWWTLVWLALAVIAGIQLMALERLAFLPRMMASLSSGQMPFAILTGSGLRFIAAGLLIFPGALSATPLHWYCSWSACSFAARRRCRVVRLHPTRRHRDTGRVPPTTTSSRASSGARISPA